MSKVCITLRWLKKKSEEVSGDPFCCGKVEVVLLKICGTRWMYRLFRNREQYITVSELQVSLSVEQPCIMFDMVTYKSFDEEVLRMEKIGKLCI